MDTKDNYLLRATAHDGLVRAFALDAGAVVDELQRRHHTDPAATAALGRLSIGALLFGAMLKEPDHLVTLRIQADGPGGTLLASANGQGEVRGLIANPQPDIEQSRNGKLNVSGVVGTRGQLTVMRDMGMRHPYVSAVELVSGEVGEDLAHYLGRSEQIPSAVGIGVFVRVNGSVAAAGGYMVQLLPGIPDDVVSGIEAAISGLPHPTVLLRNGATPETILTRIFDGRGYETLGRTPIRFACPCSRDRAERAILLLGSGPIGEMIEHAHAAGHVELKCEFCTDVYHFTAADLSALQAQL
ncbi:MAG TPA: Hsp33 family molecular chaperone HslO [Longimicrobiales bacterium]|nr:Hsp33 family molecular chaperone HslO [Longimicrobiales bacterium]